METDRKAIDMTSDITALWPSANDTYEAKSQWMDRFCGIAKDQRQYAYDSLRSQSLEPEMSNIVWYGDGFALLCVVARLDDTRTKRQKDIDYLCRAEVAFYAMAEELFVCPRIAHAFVYVGYAIWLQYNGWSCTETAPYELIKLSHPVHGNQIFTEAMRLSFIDNMGRK